MSAFPSQQPSIPRITSPTTQYMDDPGVEAYALHNQIAGEVEALAATVGLTGSTVAGTVEKRLTDAQSSLTSHTGNTSNPHSTTKAQVGLGNCDNTSDASKPVSTAQAAAIAAAQAAAIAGAPVQSVAGRTGTVTLAVADVSGAAPTSSPALTGTPTAPTASPGTSTTQIATTAFAGNASSTAQSNAIAACPAETTTTIGNLVAGASAKTVIASADKFSIADSAASNLLKSVTTADIAAALYKLGIPRTLWQSGIPFVLPGGDGGTNGLSFTGTHGVFTFSAAILSGLYAMLGGCYLYLPAGAGGIGSAGWYWAQFTDDTNGEVFNNLYTPGSGVPTWQSAPTQFGNLASGRITQSTSEITAVNLTLSGGTMGKNGCVRGIVDQRGFSSANFKTARIRGGGVTWYSQANTNSGNDLTAEFVRQNVGTENRQSGNHTSNGYLSSAANGYSASTSAIDTTVDQTIVFSLQLQSNADMGAVGTLRSISVTYGA